MISDNHRDIAVATNVTSKGTAMSLDEDATEHLIGLLTDLYSDPERAVIREYTTNGLDANRAVGNHAPVEVTLPTDLSPFLRIKDEGIGLTVKELYTVYAKYGKSTKRDSNEQVGMLGLGCKSALTYTDQFTLVARKDGVQATASISRGENGVGVLNVLDTTSTTERNGVEVIIPVKGSSMYTMPRKARDFFRFWKPGTVLVNGSQPEPISGLQVTEDIFITEDLDSDFVVMGNVPYPATIGNDLGYDWNLGYGLNVVATVPIGAVHFTPSREALHMTSKTKATLEQIKHALRDSLKSAVEKHIQDQPDRASAMREVVKWNGSLPSKYKMTDLKYKGVYLPTTFRLKDDQRFVTCHIDSHRLNAHSNSVYLYAASFPTTAFLTGYDRTSYTSGQKKKLLLWAEQQGITNTISGFALLPAGVPDAYKDFIPKEHIAKWSDVQAIKIPRNPSTGGRLPSGRIPGSYDMYVDGVWREGVPASEIDTSEPVFWLPGGYHEGYRISTYLSKQLDAYTLVTLTSNRVDKFCRNFPMAKKPHARIRKDYDAWVKTVTDEDRYALAIQQYGDLKRSLELLSKHVRSIKDPDIVAAIHALGHDVSTVSARESEFRNIISVDGLTRPDVKNPLNKYPLMPQSYYLPRKLDEVIVYLNASYEARVAREAAKAAKAAS